MLQAIRNPFKLLSQTISTLYHLGSLNEGGRINTNNIYTFKLQQNKIYKSFAYIFTCKKNAELMPNFLKKLKFEFSRESSNYNVAN